MDYSKLTKQATEIRKQIIKMVGAAGSGHPGGSLSATEIMTALYFEIMNNDSQKMDDPLRDRFVLSKGHAAPVLYAVLAERGYFPVSDLITLRKMGSKLQGHPDMRKVPGVEMSTGSLGQGLSAACGMALAAKIDNSPSMTYAMIGDGECQEGQVWEAAMFAAHYELGNLIVFLDNNTLQIDGRVCDVMNPNPLPAKWRAFNWHVQEINGHDFEEIFSAVECAKAVKNQPSMIVAHTIKGKGVSFMEDQASWHGTAPSPEQVALALAELGGVDHE